MVAMEAWIVQGLSSLTTNWEDHTVFAKSF
jgi:hypothetical protein